MHSKMEETELSPFNEDGMRVHFLSQYVFSFLKVKSMDEDKVR